MNLSANSKKCFSFLFRRFWIVVALIFPALLFAGKPDQGKRQEVERAIARIVQKVDPDLHYGIEIVSLDTGMRIYQKNGMQLFVPASSLKIMTAAAALGMLGINHRFETKIFYDGTLKEGCLQGDLYLKGGGDPELTTHDLEELALQLQLLGIREVKGRLYIDTSEFDAVAQGPGWMWDDRLETWNPPLSALTLNHSMVRLWVKPALQRNRPPLVYTIPKTSCIEVQNSALTSENRSDLQVAPYKGEKNLVEVKGNVAEKTAAQLYSVPLNNPQLYAADVLRGYLQKIGLTGTQVITEKQVPEGAQCVAVHYSQPLSIIVQEMMKSSDNLIADMLFKTLGAYRFGKPGTWTNGAQAVRDFLQKKAHLEIDDQIIVDGSGLSRYNLVSPRQLVKLLAWMHNKFPYAAEFLAALPVGGVDGTLKQRLGAENLRARVRAKTGTMQGISSLAGYVTTKSGEKLAFALFSNGFTKSPKEIKTALEDQICAALADL